MCPLCIASLSLLCAGGASLAGFALATGRRRRWRNDPGRLENREFPWRIGNESFFAGPPGEQPGTMAGARRRLLAREKQLTRLRDQVAAERRELPWVRVDKDYRFQGERGERSLAELFGGNSQLIVYHFMFAPGWSEGCVGCSFLADHIDGANRHLAHHDVSLVAVSRAPLEEFQAFRRRMGWRFDWYSSYGSDFNRDFGVSFDKAQLAAGSVDSNYQPTPDAGEEMPGASVFLRNPAGEVFHTYRPMRAASTSCSPPTPSST